MALIADPILNSPFLEPTRHFQFDDSDLDNEVEHVGFGRWAVVEVTDPWDAQRTIRAAVSQAAVASL